MMSDGFKQHNLYHFQSNSTLKWLMRRAVARVGRSWPAVVLLVTVYCTVLPTVAFFCYAKS